MFIHAFIHLFNHRVRFLLYVLLEFGEKKGLRGNVIGDKSSREKGTMQKRGLSEEE